MLQNPVELKLPSNHEYGWPGLPTEAMEWTLNPGQRGSRQPLESVVKRSTHLSPWQWPQQPVLFFADLHADAEAFQASLLASGGVRMSKAHPAEFELTAAGQRSTFVIGGDCLDKGPSNLKLLQSIRRLMHTGARVILLAGNHDVRLLMGIKALDMAPDPATEHLFLRMGPKVVPLLKEVFDAYLTDSDLQHIPSSKVCRQRLYPSEEWFRAFPRLTAKELPPKAIAKEIKRMCRKVECFEAVCRDAGLDLRQVYATAMKCRELFLQPEGEYAWFFDSMQLLHREGSFLFLHAGVDDRFVRLLTHRDEAYLNDLYRRKIRTDLFGFYYGPLANTMRTKYRDVDLPLTDDGVEMAGRYGVHVVVHGHRNRTCGQCLALRQGMIHIEGDITLDRNSRRKEGLPGVGMGVTIVSPEGRVIGISNDFPYAKVFEPQRYLQAPE